MGVVTRVAQHSITVRRALDEDFVRIGEINADRFSGNKTAGDGQDWVLEQSRNRAYLVFSAVLENNVVGYVVWRIDGGWNRLHPLTELQQIAVDRKYEGYGYGSTLIEQSLPKLAMEIRRTNRRCGNKGTIIVWTEVMNPANRLYQKFFKNGIGGFRVQYYTADGIAREENMLKGVIDIP